MTLEDEELTATAKMIASRKRVPLGLSRNEWRRVQSLANAVIRRGLAAASQTWDDVEAVLARGPGIVDAVFPSGAIDNLSFPHAHGPATEEIRLAFDTRQKLQPLHVAGITRRRTEHVRRIVGERAATREELIGFGLVDDAGLNLTSLGRRVLALIDAEAPR